MYLYGNLTGGIRYTSQLDFQGEVNGTASGNVLASYENLQNAQHTVVLSATQFTTNSKVTFTGALISVDTAFV